MPSLESVCQPPVSRLPRRWGLVPRGETANPAQSRMIWERLTKEEPRYPIAVLTLWSQFPKISARKLEKEITSLSCLPIWAEGPMHRPLQMPGVGR